MFQNGTCFRLKRGGVSNQGGGSQKLCEGKGATGGARGPRGPPHISGASPACTVGDIRLQSQSGEQDPDEVPHHAAIQRKSRQDCENRIGAHCRHETFLHRYLILPRDLIPPRATSVSEPLYTGKDGRVTCCCRRS